MARRAYRIRVTGSQRDPIDVHLLVQVVLILAAGDEDDPAPLISEGGTSVEVSGPVAEPVPSRSRRRAKRRAIASGHDDQRASERRRSS